MFLHVCPDDKFLEPFFIPNADLYSQEQNKYIVYTPKPVEKLKYVSDPRVKFAVYNSEKFWELIGDMYSYRAIVVHYLNDSMADFVLKCPFGVKIVWIFWGADGFRLSTSYSKILCSVNQDIYLKSHSVLAALGEGIQAVKKNIVYKISNYFKNIKIGKAARRVDFFAHYLREEYDFVRNQWQIKAEFIDFNYGTIEQILRGAEYDSDMDRSPYIILGNNAAYSNNHFEAFTYLQGITDGYKVYCPLSYIREKKHVSKVIDAGRDKFGDNFVPLEDFMPVSQYNTFVRNASLIVQNQYRSQGGATIWGALEHGIPLAMNKKNPLFTYFKSKGADILDIEQLSKTRNLKLELESLDHVKNKRILNENFGAQAVKSRYIKFYDILR